MLFSTVGKIPLYEAKYGTRHTLEVAGEQLAHSQLHVILGRWTYLRGTWWEWTGCKVWPPSLCGVIDLADDHNIWHNICWDESVFATSFAKHLRDQLVSVVHDHMSPGQLRYSIVHWRGNHQRIAKWSISSYQEGRLCKIKKGEILRLCLGHIKIHREPRVRRRRRLAFRTFCSLGPGREALI